jgi:hypothetical protein
VVVAELLTSSPAIVRRFTETMEGGELVIHVKRLVLLSPYKLSLLRNVWF